MDLKLRPGKIKLKGKHKKSGYDFMENIHKIPYNEDGAVIMPFREFLLYIEHEPTKSRDDYFIRKEALTWRKKQFIEKYATGEWI